MDSGSAAGRGLGVFFLVQTRRTRREEPNLLQEVARSYYYLYSGGTISTTSTRISTNSSY